MNKIIFLFLIFLLSGCQSLVKKEDTTNKSNFMRFNTDYVASEEDPIFKPKNKKPEVLTTVRKEDLTVDDITKIFLSQSYKQMSNMINQYLKNTPQPFRASVFDLSEVSGKQKYNDSNYHINDKIFSVTYRPHTLYGSDFNNYIAYCPIFYEWDKREDIVKYFTQFDINPYDKNKKYGMTFINLTEYLVFTSFSHCAALNKKYKEKNNMLSEKESILLADMFAITIFVARDEPNLAQFIIKENKKLHNNLNYEKELNNYFKMISNYFLLNPTVNSNLYELWKVTYDLRKL